MRQALRHFRKLFVHELEDRCTPAITVGLSGTNVSFIGNTAPDTLNLSIGAGPGFLLTHNVSGLASFTDLDPGTPGTQSLAASAVTNLDINLGTGSSDSLGLAGVVAPGSITTRDLHITAFSGGDATLTDTTYAYNGVTMTLNNSTAMIVIVFSGDAGDNTFDASAFTKRSVTMFGNAGNDILRGANSTSGNDDLRGGDGDDVLEGNGGNDFLDAQDAGARGGSDTLRGGDGSDSLVGDNGPTNNGADIYDGGPGTDTVTDVGSNVTLTNTTFTTDGAVSNNHGVEDWFFYGTLGNDTIDASAWTGAAGFLLYGYSGNDTLRGGAGFDDIRGGDGDDTLEGNGGNDALDFNDGGQRGGNDTLRGGAGNDNMNSDASPTNFSMDIYDGGPDTDRVDEAVSIATLTPTTYTGDGVVSNNHNVENWNIYGTLGNDTIDCSTFVGNGMLLYGYAGNDILKGGSGADDIRGGDGDDVLEGNGGNDALDFNDGGQRGGNDTLRGGDGNDNMNSDPGTPNFTNDIYEGGAGTGDFVQDGATTITLTDTMYTTNGLVTNNHQVERWEFYGTDNADTFDASTFSGTAFGIFMLTYKGADILKGGLGADDLRGGDGDDVLEGNGGNDALDWNDSGQRGGNDTLHGGDGNDLLCSDTFANISLDVLDAGAGSDTGFDIVINATVTDALYTADGVNSPNPSIETWTIYGTAADNIIDASGYNFGTFLMYGLAGADTLKGGSGNDDLRGGNDDDILEGNGGNDQLDWSDSGQRAGNDTLRGGAGNDLLAGGAGDDILEGGDENDNLAGGDNNDLLRDGPGTNTLNGEAGTDTIEMYGTTGPDLLLVNATTFTVNGGVNTMSNHEVLTGDMLAGIDEGTEIAANPLPYTVANLEPTVYAGVDVANTDTPFVITRNGSFKDIGAGQTWTATVDYAEGGGFVPLALNANKTFTLNHAYSSGGIFNVRVRVTDNLGSVGEDSFLLIRPAGIQVGVAGGAQRSMITQLTISFADERFVSGNWYTFQRLSPGPLPTISVTQLSAPGTPSVFRLTFGGPGLELSGSLQDGDYYLTLNSNLILNGMGQAFDGDASGAPGGNFLYPFHRLFGDVNGDRTVEGSIDFALFGGAFALSAGQTGFTPAFDFNNDGTVEGSLDFAQFGQRFGITLPNP